MPLNFAEIDTSVNADRRFGDLRLKVSQGLDLNNLLKDRGRETRLKISSAIASTVGDSSFVLGIEPPNAFAVLPSEKSRENVAAMMRRTQLPDRVLYEMYFNADVIKDLAEGVENNTLASTALDRVRLITAHEMYHIRAAERFPERFAREASDSEYNEHWVDKREEFAAELFSLQFVKNRLTFGWKDSLRKFISELGQTHKLMTIQIMRERNQKAKRAAK